MHGFSVSNSSSATSTTASISTAISQNSQPDTAGGQHPRGSLMGLTTTVCTPELAPMPATYHQQDELGLLSEIGTTETEPFEVLATHQPITFDDDDQGQSVSPLSLSNEPSRSQKSSQSVDDVLPIVSEEQSLDPSDKWIIIALTRHMPAHHTFERRFRCKICGRRFRLQHHLRRHKEHVHFIKSKKKSPKPQSVSESSSATATSITASTSTITSGISLPESAAGQRQQDSFVDLSKTVHMPESTHTVAEHQFTELRLLAEACTSQIEVDPFEELAIHQTVTFDDDNQGQSASSLSLANEASRSHKSSQLVDDVLPIVREEQSPDPTDEWIIVDKSQARPFKCGYPGCDGDYRYRHHLRRHFVKHTGTSKFKCPHPQCVGNEYFGDNTLLKRHIATKHTPDKPFQCARCNKRFMRKENLKYHREHVHSPENEQKSPKRKKK